MEFLRIILNRLSGQYYGIYHNKAATSETVPNS